jgi:hypothetical protein
MPATTEYRAWHPATLFDPRSLIKCQQNGKESRLHVGSDDRRQEPEGGGGGVLVS